MLRKCKTLLGIESNGSNETSASSSQVQERSLIRSRTASGKSVMKVPLLSVDAELLSKEPVVAAPPEAWLRKRAKPSTPWKSSPVTSNMDQCPSSPGPPSPQHVLRD
ncbi:hypothetical protein DUNSADRAFT_14126 [Dunaliella salina]|uniref:Encoded protein n=1 Tax=Dunaliella salina TaxID=3046 RepID=A0ABQ7G7Y8_DUNSA|nr:hypothetical protein DUNSADRAFT_14126 [Dunaliella salina]|eukprot:KAF5830720.1 hypothetical protein DUNSADRAFT_14126 [Dunaliella salina]